MTSSIVAAGAPRDGEFHPRRWAAVLLSILLPGLGHFYLGQRRRAIVVFIVLQAWVAALASLMVVAPTAPLRFALFVLPFGGALAVLLDAVRVARRGTPAPRRMVQRWYVLALVYVGVGLVVQLWTFGWWSRTARTSSSGMTERIASTAAIGGSSRPRHSWVARCGSISRATRTPVPSDGPASVGG